MLHHIIYYYHLAKQLPVEQPSQLRAFKMPICPAWHIAVYRALLIIVTSLYFNTCMKMIIAWICSGTVGGYRPFCNVHKMFARALLACRSLWKYQAADIQPWIPKKSRYCINITQSHSFCCIMPGYLTLYDINEKTAGTRDLPTRVFTTANELNSFNKQLPFPRRRRDVTS